MAKIFYGAAIQGNRRRGELAEVHTAVLEAITSAGHVPVSEHIRGATREETAALLDAAVGPLPPLGDPVRKVAVRRKMIAAVEGDIGAAIFECSVPSLGTGIEFAHAYLRPGLGLPEIPILCLYHEGFWSNGLSSMVSGITPEELPNAQVVTYRKADRAAEIVKGFLERRSR